MLAGDLQHALVDLVNLVTRFGVFRQQRTRQRAGRPADVQNSSRAVDPHDQAYPAQIIELQVSRVGEVDVGRVHVGLPQEPSRRPMRIALDDQIPFDRDHVAARASHGATLEWQSMTDAASPALDPDTSRLLADARRICSVPAPLHGERPRAELVVQMFDESGVVARIDEIGNVIAWFGPTDEPAAVLAAHLDTVFSRRHPDRVRRGRRPAHPHPGSETTRSA